MEELDEPMMTALDVARRLQISRASVYNFVDRLILPVVRFGALLRFRPSDVRALCNPPRSDASVEAKKPKK